MTQVVSSNGAFLPLSPPPQSVDKPPVGKCDVDQASPVPGTACGPYGERLVVHVVDELARRTPERIWATISRSPYHLDDGFRDITMRQLANAVNCAAWKIDAHFGRSKTFDVIAFLGVSDVRYAIHTFAAIKTGRQIMIPSVRNALSQHLSVFEAAACDKVFYTVEMEQTVIALKQANPSIQSVLVPSLDELINTPSEHYEYNRTWAEGRTDPIIIAHSSGSTGNPKPTTITNGVYSVYDNHRKIQPVNGRKIQCYSLLELGGDKFFNPFPPFHLAGLFAMTIMPIFYNCTVALGPEEKPPSGEILSQAMRQLKVRAAWCPPSVIEQLVALPGGFEQAAQLDWIMYTGGPLAPAAGDRLSKVTDVCQMYGSTETGPHTALVPLPENWNYFEWHPLMENEMDPMGDGTFEMVVHKDPSQDWIRHLSQAYPNLEVWRTNDLFIQAPHNPKLWRFVGRRDDVIVLSNGEKFNPVNMEGVITGHPLVKGAVIVGTARFQASLVVEPVGGLDMTAEQLIEEIWPTVEKANSVGPAHGRIFPSKVTVAVPEKPFIRAGKGTIIRGQTTRLYASEVDKLYDEGNEEAKARVPKFEDRQSLESVTSFVRACVLQLMPKTTPVSDEDDFFVLGMDSLQTLELLKTVQRALKASTEVQQSHSNVLTVAGIYSNPSVKLLAEHLHGLLNGGDNAMKPIQAQHRIKAMARMVEEHTSGLPGSVERQQRVSSEPRCVAITGSTGSLGHHLLEEMLGNKNITKVYCLNRRQDAMDIHKQGFNKQCDLEERVVFLTVRFGEPRFGLSDADYERLRNDVDAIIHNAWKVNFNHTLASFEKEHVRGVRDLIDLCLSSPRQPHLFFVSSLSSVGNWAACDGATGAVPERMVEDYNVAMEMGYGESKHVSERIISTAVANSGLHASVLRVGQIAGPLGTGKGEWHRTEWFPSLIKTSKSLGAIPDSMNTIDWIPIDTLAAVIREIMQREYLDESFRVFNLVNCHEANWMDLVPTFQKHWPSNPLKAVPFSEWIETLRQLDSPDLEALPALKILDFYVGYAAEAALPREQRLSYQTQNCIDSSPTMASLGPIHTSAAEIWLGQWNF